MRAMALAAAAAFLAQPVAAAAAEDRLDLAAGERRSAAFAGASFRVPLGGGETRAPALRLQLAITHHVEDRGSAQALRSVRSPGLELGAGGGGEPRLTMAGRTLPELKRQLGFKGSTGWIIAGGAVVALGAALLLLGDCDACDAEPAN